MRGRVAHARVRLVVVAALALGLRGARAGAQTADVDGLIAEGVRLRRGGSFEEALGLFRAAYERSHGARARAQMGLTEQGLGRWSDAFTDLRAALAETADPWIERNRATLAGALDVVEGRVGRLAVVGAPAGAEVLFNGRPVGALPMREAATVDAGSGALVVRSRGYLEVRRSVTVPARGEARESVELVEESPPAPAQARAPSPVERPPAAERRAPVAPSPAPAATPRTRVGAIVAGSAAVALAGVGVAGLVWRSDVVSGFNAMGQCLGALDDASYVRCAQLRGEASDAQGRAEVLAGVGLGVAGALAVTAAVLLALPARARTEGRAAGFACTPGPGAVGLACGARF